MRFISGIEKTIEPQAWTIEIAGREVAVRISSMDGIATRRSHLV